MNINLSNKSCQVAVTNNMIRRGLIVLIFLASFIKVNAQDSSEFFDAKTIENYHITRYTNANGLKQTIVEQLFLDENEFLWLQTPSGIVRFDGSQFSYFKSGQGINSRTQLVRKVQTEDNAYYVQFPDSKFGKIKDGSYEDLSASENSEFVVHQKQFVRKHEGEYESTFLNQIGENIKSFKSIHPINVHDQYYRKIDSIFFIHDGILSTTYIDNLLIRGQAYALVNKEFILNNHYFILRNDLRIVELNQGERIKIHNELVRKVSSKKIKLVQEDVNVISHPSQQKVFITTKDSIYQVQLMDKKLEYSALDIQVSIPDITGVAISSDTDNIFISSTTLGFFQLRKKKFNSYYDADHKGSQSYMALIETNQGDILTSKGKLVTAKQTVKIKSFNRSINFIKQDSNSIIAISGQKAKILNFNSITRKTYISYQHSSNHLIYDGSFDSQNRLWLLGRLEVRPKKTTTLGYIDSDNNYHRIDHIFPMIWSKVWTPEGNIQLLGENNIYSYDITTQDLDSIPTPTALEIRSVHYLNDTISLMASYNAGLWYNVNGQISKLQIENENINESNCILEDDNGYIWVTTNNGLFRFHPYSLENYINLPSDEIFYDYYDLTYGLLTNEFNGGGTPCATVLKNGRIAFPTVQGIVTADPQDFINKNIYKPIVIIETTVDNIRIDTANLIQLSPGFQRISFTLHSPNYDVNANRHLYYMLEGFEDKWNRYDANKGVSYTNLKPGNYSFKSKLLSGSKYNEVSTQDFTFSVDINWYQSSFFITIFISLIALMTNWFMGMRVRYLQREKENLEKEVLDRTKKLRSLNHQQFDNLSQLRKTELKLTSTIKVKNKLLGIISHEVLGSIQMIKTTSELIHDKRHLLNEEEVQNALKDIKNTSYATSTVLLQILTWTKAQNEGIAIQFKNTEVYSVIEIIYKKLKHQAKTRDINLYNQVNKNFSINTDSNLLLLILHSLIENEVKHNESASITTKCYKDNEIFSLQIRNDNDVETFDIDSANRFFTSSSDKLETLDNAILIKGLGFWIIKDLINKINGKIKFIRCSSSSHTIIIDLPLTKHIS